jgi:hypothetical protein
MRMREPPPGICPQCGSPRTARVLWDCVYLSRRDEEDVTSGTAILACPQVVLKCEPWQALMRSMAGKLPAWVCLACVPDWSDVHRLALQSYRWQGEKEGAVGEADFERAAELMHRQDRDRDRIITVVTELLRDIFGNPFRPVAFSPVWRTDTAVSLAKQMYESRDFSAMPILADALQDAGCDSDELLNHCRGEGPHVRGCWAIDLVLGKE